jgi:pSer/pThr/pTyr-binding forkhead associated (FHA) protein
LRLAAETGASVRHARISNVDGYVTIEDLGSTNRTMVNGNVIDSPTRLRVGDRVYIGLVTLEARR